MNGNGQTNRISQPPPPLLNHGAIEALVGLDDYRKFTRAFAELTGFRVTLLPASTAPLAKLTVPMCCAGHVVALLQISDVEPMNSGSKRSLLAARLVEIFAKYLELASDRAVFEARNSEPPIIQRAKSYIQTHYATELSLSKTATFLNVSRFHLCKLFRKTTGSTFSGYVSAVRVERARQLLLGRSLRVSEIAFDVGFQSLTHFNRTFRNATGCSPSQYRKHGSHGAA